MKNQAQGTTNNRREKKELNHAPKQRKRGEDGGKVLFSSSSGPSLSPQEQKNRKWVDFEKRKGAVGDKKGSSRGLLSITS